MAKKTSKKTICALVAGSITALGLTGLCTYANKQTLESSSESRQYSGLDAENTGGWYTNKVRRGQVMRKRIFKYMS